MKAWQFVAAVVMGVLLSWFFRAGPPPPDPEVIEELRDSVAAARERTKRDSMTVRALADTVAAYRDTVDAVTAVTHRVVEEASRRASAAEAEVREALERAGESTEALDSLTSATEAQLVAKDSEIAALRAERAILFRRVEAGDAEAASLRAELERRDLLDEERNHITDRLRAEKRSAVRRERIAEGVAVLTLALAVTSG